MNSPDRKIPTTPLTENGFTLLEIMVAIFIFAIVITTVFGSFRAVFSSAGAVGGDVAVFESARTCLDPIWSPWSFPTIPGTPNRSSTTRRIVIAWSAIQAT